MRESRPNVFQSQDQNQAGQGVTCRFDRVELAVRLTKSNTVIWYGKHAEIAAQVATAIRGEIGRSSRTGEGSNYQWDRRIEAENVRVDVFGPKKHQDGENPAPYKGALARIRITSRNKMDYTDHHQALESVHRILSGRGLTYRVSIAELAFDSLDEGAAQRFATKAWLKWGRQVVFNYESGKFRHGGSDEGRDEYQAWRRQARQKHVYFKPRGGVWRSELTLRRPYLRRKGIRSVSDLFFRQKHLTEECLTFTELNTARLYRDYPNARFLGLEKNTPLTAIEKLVDFTGDRRDRIRRKYFRPATDGPIINYAPIFNNTLKSGTFPDTPKPETKAVSDSELSMKFERFGDTRGTDTETLSHGTPRQPEKTPIPVEPSTEQAHYYTETHGRIPRLENAETQPSLFNLSWFNHGHTRKPLIEQHKRTPAHTLTMEALPFCTHVDTIGSVARQEKTPAVQQETGIIRALNTNVVPP